MIQRINPYNYKQMEAASTSHVNAGFVGGQEQFTPQGAEEKNIFASEGNTSTSSISGLSGITAGSNHGIDHIRQNLGGDVGLVERLNRIDAAYQKPQQQDEYRANKLDFYA